MFATVDIQRGIPQMVTENFQILQIITNQVWGAGKKHSEDALSHQNEGLRSLGRELGAQRLSYWPSNDPKVMIFKETSSALVQSEPFDLSPASLLVGLISGVNWPCCSEPERGEGRVTVMWKNKRLCAAQGTRSRAFNGSFTCMTSCSLNCEV